MKTIDRTELERWTQEEQPFALLDVLPGDPTVAHSAEELPHTHSQADFMNQVASLGRRKDEPVVLYEAASASIYPAAAAAMLEQSGFSNVYHFIGPQTSLHAAGHNHSDSD